MVSKILMSLPTDASVASASLSVSDFLEHVREEFIAAGPLFSYCFLGASPGEDELKEFVEEPIAALPPAVTALLPRIRLCFVPFLERPNGNKKAEPNGRKAEPSRRPAEDLVSLRRPAKVLPVSRLQAGGAEYLVFPFEDREVGEYHYRFFQSVSTMVAENLPAAVESGYQALVRHELRANVHGEVDDTSWEKKIALLERLSRFHGSNKSLRDYARHSFIDTLTLYLHGICCDLDVDTGPRQLPSRHLRKRLEMLEAAFPPPQGYAVFPEELKD
jgi:hypothetical protein